MGRRLRRIDDSDADDAVDVVAAKTDRGRPRPRILYVEDEDANWRVAYKSLSDRYDLVRAATARETFERLAMERFAAILMDIQLADSDLDGIEITKILCGDPSIPRPTYVTNVTLENVPPIIFMTAYTARYSKAELVAAGGVDVVSKPVDLVILHLRLARAVTSKLT